MSNTMETSSSLKVLVLSLIIALAIPYGLLVAPPPTHAAGLPVWDAIQDTVGLAQWILSVIEETLTEVAVYLQYALDYYQYIKEYILEPLTFIQSGKAVQSLTGGVLAFVSGSTNGTGQPQFMTRFQTQQQRAGDNAARAFFGQFMSLSDSPYARAITSSLRTNYLQRTSVDGYFSAQRNTLPRYTRNQDAYLAGDWTQGGPGAWFALTTQRQNNPYMLYEDSQAQLGLLVGQSQETQRAQADWSHGYLSWCGTEPQGPDDVDPQAPCTKADGTEGSIQTPGSTISAYLDKGLGLSADKVAQMGNASTQISSIMGSIMDIMKLGQSVIGGDQGGLAGVGNADSSGRTLLDTYTQATSTFMGAGQCSINKTASKNSATNGSELLGRIGNYLKSWKTIGASAATAQTTVTALRDHCASELIRAQTASPSWRKDRFILEATDIKNSANTALDSWISDAISTAAAASSTADAAIAYVAEVNADLNAPPTGDPPGCLDYSDKIDAFSTKPPTSSDLGSAMYDSKQTYQASTSPPGTLNLVPDEGTTVDQMSVLSTNARQGGDLWNACTAPGSLW